MFSFVTDVAAAAAGDPWLPTLNATLFLLVAGLMGEGDCIERASFPSPASPDVLALAVAAGMALEAAAAALVSLISRLAILASAQPIMVVPLRRLTALEAIRAQAAVSSVFLWNCGKR